jgi:LysR family transcriptional regulator, low CO2-responsive transcriptional regulator
MLDATLKQLRIVSTIARTGKIQKAAELLNVTPPAITLQLKQLEDALGLPLFERTRHGMKQTQAGQLLLESANRIEAELAACEDGLGAIRGLTSGTVHLGVVSTGKYFAPAALGAFKRQYPDLDIKLFVGNREDTIRGLALLEFDMAIMGRPPESLHVKSATLGDHPHVIIAWPDHPLAKGKAIAAAELAGEPFLMRELGSGTRNLTERYFAQAGIGPRVAMEISSNETIKQAVMGGLGIALISAHTIGAELETGRLVMLDVMGLPAWRQWRIARHIEKRLTPAAAALWSFLESQAAQFLPGPDLRKGDRMTGGNDWAEE